MRCNLRVDIILRLPDRLVPLYNNITLSDTACAGDLGFILRQRHGIFGSAKEEYGRAALFSLGDLIMSASNLRIRIRFTDREFEIEGSESTVEKWFEKLSGSLGTAKGGLRTQLQLSPGDGNGSTPPSDEVTDQQRPFGEYLHTFTDGITDVDRVLIAGNFVQEGDPDRSFTTRAASDLLKEQGIKLSNPSASLKRNQDSRACSRWVKDAFEFHKPGLSISPSCKPRRSSKDFVNGRFTVCVCNVSVVGQVLPRIVDVASVDY